VPAPIVINEAVDLSKFFSESQSGKFVNGVLDSYAKSLAEKPFTP
jgi:transcription termination factor NusB